MDRNYVGTWLFEGFDYPRHPDWGQPGHEDIRGTEHIYVEPFEDREFWVYHHSPGWGEGWGNDTFIASARYMVTRQTWQIKDLKPGHHFASTRYDIEEPSSGPLALEAILSLARQQNPRAADLPVYLSSRWPVGACARGG